MRSEIAQVQGKPEKGLEELQLALVYDPESLHLLTEQAKLCLELGKRRRAKTLIDRAWRLLPKRGPARLAMVLLKGRLAVLEGRFNKAEQILRRAVQSAPKSWEAARALVDVLLKRFRRQAAVRVLQRAAKRLPKMHEPLALLAEIEEERGRFTAQAKALERAVARAPRSTDLLFSLTTTYERLLRRDEALARWRAFIEEHPADKQALFQAARLELAFDHDQRAEELLTILQAQGRSVDHEYDIARMLMSEGRYARAISSLEEVVRQRPAHQGARFMLGLARLQSGDDQGALSELEQLGPDSQRYVEARLRIVDTLMELGKFRRAEIAIRQALKKRPKSAALQIKLATLIERRGDMTGALEILSAAQKTTEQRLRLTSAKAELLRRAGRFEEAVKLMRSLRGEVNERDRLYEMATLYEAASDGPKTVEMLKKSLKLSSDGKPDARADALNFLGFYYVEQGRALKEAERLLRRALELRPASAAILDSLGWLHVKNGALERAAPLLRRASKLQPRDPEIVEHLGDLFVKQGARKQARSAYGKAREFLKRMQTARAPGREGDLERVKRKLASLK